jgi:PAS domain S-box-containing protein/putative nucleotidyltransferase with HDIG domain
MADEQRTKERLLDELAALRRRLDGVLEAEAESKRTAEALRESEARYRSFVENFQGIAFRGDMEFVPYFFHGAVEAITGYTQEEFVAGVPRWDQIIHPDDLPGYLSQLLGRPNFTTDREYRIVRKDDQVRWVRELIQVVYGEPGELRYVDGLIFDITERKRSEKALQDRTEDVMLVSELNEAVNRGDSFQALTELLSGRVKTAYECGGATAYILSEDKEYLLIQNLSLPAAIQTRIEELIGTAIRERQIRLSPGGVYHGILESGEAQIITDPDTIQAMIAECTENRLLKRLAPQIHRILGRVCLISVPLVLHGEPVGLLEISRPEPFASSDVHRLESIARHFAGCLQRKRMEEALAQRERRYRGLFENSPVALWELDYSGVKTYLEGLHTSGASDLGTCLASHPEAVRGWADRLTAVDVNQAAISLYEARDKADLRRSLHQLFAEQPLEVLQAELLAIAKGDTVFEAETGARTLTGEERVIARRWTVSPGCEETLDCVVVSDVDITERKRMELETLRRNEELSALYALAETLSRSLDMSNVLQGGLEKALEIMGTECGGVYLADQATRRLTLAAHRGVSDKFAAQIGTIDVDQETIKRVSELGRAGKLVLVTELLLKDTSLLRSATAAIASEGLRSYVQALIQSKGVPVGLLVVASRESRRFTRHEEELLSTIANEIGMAIENSRLYEEVRARSTYLETLQRINSTLRSTQPLPTVLDTIVQSATVAFDYAGSLIITPAESRDRLVFAAASGGMLMDAALKLTGLKLESYSLPLEGSENPMARAFLTGELEAWGGDPPRIVKGVQPSISPVVASAIARAMRGQSAACVPLPAAEKTVGVLTVISHRPAFSDDEVAMLLGLANQAGLAIENAKLYEDAQRELAERKIAQEELSASVETLERTLKGAVSALAATTKYRDPYTAGHQELVTDLACAIAKEMALPEARIDGLRVAGQLHDLGKIALPAEVLTKPSKLTETETLLIRTHVQAGYEILKTIDFPWPVAEIVLQHHERMDGSGYPQGLAGDDILLEARILAVADVVEAMARHRPYRPALGIDKALEEISLNKGVLFDPAAVDACLKLITEGLFDPGQPPALVGQPQS